MSNIDGGLRPIFRKYLPQIDWQSIETGGTGRGIPDSNGCCDGVEFWLEYKATKGWTVSLRPEQIGWIMRRVRHGGRVLIAVRRHNAVVDDLWVLPGRLAVEAKAGGLRGLADAPGVRYWHGGPSTWDWRAIAARLLS